MQSLQCTAGMDLLIAGSGSVVVQTKPQQQKQHPENRLELGPPSAELQNVATRELRETPEVREFALEKLRGLVQDDPSLNFRTDDEFLLRFLRPTKFYPESALELLRGYLKHMRRHAGVYSQLGMAEQRAVLQTAGLVSVSPLRDQQGRRVTIIKFGAWLPKVCSMDELYCAAVACAEVGVCEPSTQVAGGVAVIDMRGTSLKHVTNLSPAYAKRTIDWVQGSFPLRFKAFHIINQPRLFDLVYAVFKPFMGPKLKDRIHFHGSDLTALHRHVSPTCLVKEHGGSLESYDQKGLVEVIEQHDHIFNEIRSYALNCENKEE